MKAAKITTDPAVPVYQAIRWNETEGDWESLGVGTNRDELWRRTNRVCDRHDYPGFTIVEYPAVVEGKR